jgi:sigma-E factor negative regulatory protein RseA
MEAMDKMDKREMISALADGQLRGEALALGVQAAAADAQAREAWCAYHLVGEVLRTGRATPGSRPEDFLAKLQLRLREEQPLSAPLVVTAAAPVRMDRPAANDWRWKLVAGFASVAAVAAVGWNMVAAPGTSGQPQIATAPATSAVAQDSASAMIRDPRLDQFLAAHRQFGGATALQTSSGFLRNATFEGPAR